MSMDSQSARSTSSYPQIHESSIPLAIVEHIECDQDVGLDCLQTRFVIQEAKRELLRAEEEHVGNLLIPWLSSLLGAYCQHQQENLILVIGLQESL